MSGEDLYDPLSMPPAELVKAHADLDRAVDLCYRPQPFTSERQRMEYLFGLYEQLTAPLLPAGWHKVTTPSPHRILPVTTPYVQNEYTVWSRGGYGAVTVG